MDEEMIVIFGAGGPGKSDSSAANSEPGPNPESRVQDPEPANSEPDSFAGTRVLLDRVKGLVVKDFIRCYEESKPEQPSLTRALVQGYCHLPRSVQDPKLSREEDQNLHRARARQRPGFGGKRWSREWLNGTLGLFNETVWPLVPTVAPI